MMPGRAWNLLRESVRPYYLKYLYARVRRGKYPPEFERWRSYTAVALGPGVKPLLPAATETPEVIFLPMADWHGIRQRTQHLARGLAALGHRCVYLNPHLGREFAEAYPFSPKRVVTALEAGVIELHIHLPREPVFHHRCLTPAEEEELFESLAALLHHIRSKRQLLIVSFPLWTGVAARLRREFNSTVIYDCHDLLEGFDGIAPSLLQEEGTLLDAADLVVFSSGWLSEQHIARRTRLAGRSAIIRNAVDPADFAQSSVQSVVTEPVIGYVGSLNSWFDSEAVSRAARAHPEWRFVLVGPLAEGFSRTPLKGLPNVRIVGEVPHSEVASWMSQFRVSTIPFRLMPLTAATNPVKLYEYFACGLPVVSSRLDEVERYSDLLYIADSPDDFVVQLERALLEEDPAKREARRTVARKENWLDRCQSLRDAVSEVLL